MHQNGNGNGIFCHICFLTQYAWAIATEEDRESVRSKRDCCCMAYDPLHNLVPCDIKGRKGLPLRGDFVKEIVTIVLEHFDANARVKDEKECGTHTKRPPRPVSVDFDFTTHAMTSPQITRSAPYRYCKNNTQRLTLSTLLDKVAIGMYERLDYERGWISTTCEWLNHENHWSRIVKEIRENFTLIGSRVMYKNEQFQEPKIQERKAVVTQTMSEGRRRPRLRHTKGTSKQLSKDQSMEYVASVGNQYVSKARFGGGNKTLPPVSKQVK